MQKANPAQRRYIWRFSATMGAYAVVLFFSTWAAATWHAKGALLVLLSVLPAVPLLGVILVMGLYLTEERDEFIRNRLVTSMIGGLGLLLAVTTVWGFLEMGEVVRHFPTFLTFPAWCAGMGIVQCLLNLRDRVTGAGA